MKIILYIILGIIGLSYLFGSIGKDDNINPPYINWSNYAPYKKIGIEKSVSERSCSGLQRAFNASSKSEMLNYINWHLKDLGCYK